MALSGRWIIPVLGALVAALPAAGAQPARGPTAAGTGLPLLGCYALFDRSGMAALGRVPGTPAVVRLDTVTAAAPPDVVPRFALPADTAPRLQFVAMTTDLVHSAGDFAGARARWRHNRWSVSRRGDSLEIAFTTRFTGVGFAFGLPAAGGGWVAVGDTLVGRALEVRDAGPPHRIDHGRAAAVRVACPVVGAARGPAGSLAQPPNEALQTS